MNHTGFRSAEDTAAQANEPEHFRTFGLADCNHPSHIRDVLTPKVKGIKSGVHNCRSGESVS